MVITSLTTGTPLISILFSLKIDAANIGSVAFFEPETSYSKRKGKYMRQKGVTLPKI